MDMRFEQLFSITCLHDYFADRQCPSLAIQPTAATARYLRNYGLLFRPTASGGVVLYEARDEDTVLLQAANEPITLVFTLQLSDAQFINYTHLSLHREAPLPADAVYYFSNRLAMPPSDEEDASSARPALLHSERAVRVEDRLAVSSPSFTVTPSKDTTVWAVNQADVRVWGGDAVAQQPLRIYLGQEPPGRYRIFESDTEVAEAFVHDASTRATWGVVELVVGATGEVPLAYSLFEQGKLVRREYGIRFENRATIWRYLLVMPSSSAPSPTPSEVGDVYITQKDGTKSSFKASGTQQVGARTAQVFVSEAPIPLWQRPGDHYSCWFKHGGQKHRLPFAPTTSVTPDATGNGQVYSDIYVYL